MFGTALGGEKMIVFRADGNPQIGTGHVMRCLSLADAFRERGIRSAFVTAEPYMRPLIQDRGYECFVLDSPYDRMEEEFPALLPLLRTERPAAVILDSYFVTPEYMSALRAESTLAYIDDLAAFDYPADVVVNYNLYGETMDYPPGKAYLLGPRYAPLREQFRNLAPRTAGERTEGILISTGGTDQYHVALRCVEYLLEHPPVSGDVYHIVLGAMNRDAEQIEQLAAAVPYIEPHRQVADMCGLMLQCEAAVSAAGTTLYELCACGLPAVTYILADNQMQGAAAFEAAGLMPCAGDVRRDPSFPERIFSKLERLMADPRGKEAVSRRMQRLVDGEGAAHLAEALEARLREN